jgi:predicted ester cyclase
MKPKNAFLVISCVCMMHAISSCDNQKTMELEKYQQIVKSESRNIDIVRKQVDFFDHQQFDSLTPLFADDFSLYMGSSQDAIVFKDALSLVKMFYSAFPDYNHNIERIVSSGEFVIAQFLFTGTHINSFMEIEPTNNKIEYRGIIIYKIQDNKIVEMTAIEDELTLLKQLGLNI